MLSTVHRRHILDLFAEKSPLSFRELKEYFVDTKEMNTTTLYRIIDAFLDEGVIHEIEIDKDRIFLLCHHHTGEGVKLSYCTRCTNVSESHFPLSSEAIRSTFTEYLRHCPKCHSSCL